MSKFRLVLLAALMAGALALAQGAPLRVAMLVAQGGLGDRSYNDSGFAGLTLAAQQLGVQIRAIESQDPVAEGERLLTAAAQAGFDLVITLEFTHFDPLARVAPEFPDTRFAILNIVVDQPNVTSVIFEEHVGSFLAGALAAMMTTRTEVEGINPEKVLGVIGGTQSVGIDKFIVGYQEGARFIDLETQVLVSYSNSFGDPVKGRELALAMFEQGADIVYQVAGGTGEGVIAAAAETGHFAIGVDSDQDFLAPGHVLTSMLKRADVAVFQLIQQAVSGEPPGGILRLGLANGGIDLSPMIYTRHLIPRDVTDRLAEIRQMILDGTIAVTDITMF